MGILGRQTVFAIVIAWLAVWIAGCGDSGGRQALSGVVSLDSQPLPAGTITFRPLQSGGGPTSGGKIDRGKYSIPANQGVESGRFRVEIKANRPTGRKEVWEVTGEEFEHVQQYLPPKYNYRSELTVEVTAEGPNKFSFDLKMK